MAVRTPGEAGPTGPSPQTKASIFLNTILELRKATGNAGKRDRELAAEARRITEGMARGIPGLEDGGFETICDEILQDASVENYRGRMQGVMQNTGAAASLSTAGHVLLDPYTDGIPDTTIPADTSADERDTDPDSGGLPDDRKD